MSTGDLPDFEATLRKVNRTEQAEAEDEIPPITMLALDVKDRRGKHYTGNFYYAVPTLGDQIKMGQIKTGYLGQGGTPDVNATSIVEVLTYLTVCIHFDDKNKKPAWWNPLAMYDLTPYMALYTRCLEYEAKFHGEASVGGDDREADRTATESARERSVSVGRKVSPPAERRETLAGHDT